MDHIYIMGCGAHRLTVSHRWTHELLLNQPWASQGARPRVLIDGHNGTASVTLSANTAHRLTGFSSMDTKLSRQHWNGFLRGVSSMDTRAAARRGKFNAGAPPDGFLIDGHQDVHRRCTIARRWGTTADGFLIDGRRSPTGPVLHAGWRTA